MKKYLICEDVYEDYGNLYISTDENVEKNDLVVYMDYERPSLAKVVNFMDELNAITSDKHFHPLQKLPNQLYLLLNQRHYHLYLYQDHKDNLL